MSNKYNTCKKTKLAYAVASACSLFALGSLYVSAAHHQQGDAPTKLNDADVITVTAPAHSPLTLTTSPKTPRQPVPASDGADYLKTIPGFSQIRNGGTNGDVVFRGMFGSRLKILTDGAEILGTCGSRMDAPTSYISPETFDALTVVKGPQSVLWGSGASAGTILFEREHPHFTETGVAGNGSLLVGSNGRWDKNIDISLGGEQGYVRVMGNQSQAGDYKDGNGARVPSKWSKWNTDVAVGWTPNTDTLLEVTAGKGDGEARYATRGMDGSQFKRDSLGMRFEQSNIGDVLDKIEAKMYYSYVNHIMDNSTLRTPPHMAMSGNPDRRTIGARMMGTWLWQDVKMELGGDWQTDTHRKNNKTHWSKNASFTHYGLFGELGWDLDEQNKLITGARLDHHSVINYRRADQPERLATLPAGFMRLEHHVADMPLMFYAGVGHTERFPDFWELFSPTFGPNGTTSAFDGVKSEKTTQLDIGGQYNGQQFSAWVSGYAGRVNDFILFKYDPKDLRKSQADNINATIMGGEAGIAYGFNDNWKTDASLAYARGQNTSDNRPLPQISPLEARLGLTYESGGWSSTALWRLVSSQQRVAINEGNVVGKDFASSAGFGVLSANVAYKFNEQVKVSSGIDNLLNKDYSEHLNLAGNSGFGYSSNTPVNEPGRTIWAKLNVTF
ncbi:TonB-dependent copper receptor [Yersinia ruckeri]|uniref:TonB-dependent copper receptor n=1 Tax=Yersinia ruckeri TaxID=29486 RepID=UPI0008FDBC5B|nr:TonB-dependent copper receptor [Yersinia ruckeri]OJB92369.1 TonB-dependent copper receptor [Yersinia ruckeri]OJB95528.1 TonB-dependent copper receptor [Yersinia ruckeri]OJC02476.1 TonB-dependent copper receptor [Yersinia ruckeri]